MADVGIAVRAETAPRNGHSSGRRARAAGAAGAGRRRGGPGGRAVLGGLLVAAALVGLYYASTEAQGGPRESYVVTSRAIPPGARLEAADLTRLALDLPAALAARAFHDPATLVGATVVAPLGAGDLVQSSAVVSKPSGQSSREVTFAVARTSLADSLEQGERIDVVATFGSGTDAFSTVVLRQVLVVALDRGRARVGDQRDAVVTVAVDEPGDAVAFAHALQLAKLTVVRSTGAAAVPGSAPAYRQPAPAARS